MEKLRIGDALDKGVDLGPIVSPAQLQKIRHLVEKGIADGGHCWQPRIPLPKEGFFYPPTLFTEIEPAHTVAQVEISGPVVVTMTFRNPGESVELSNNSRYGLSASIWTENINLALDIIPRLKAGVVWVNSTNLFDASSGFGGYRESGFGRDGGNEGMYEYLAVTWERHLPAYHQSEITIRLYPSARQANPQQPLTNRSSRLYIGGKVIPSDSGYSFSVEDANGRYDSDTGLGNREDIRKAVDAAKEAAGWSRATAYLRSQILFSLGEELSLRSTEYSARLTSLTGASHHDARLEVQRTVERLFYYAGWADKYDGSIHQTPFRNLTLLLREPWGIVGVICPAEQPLLAFISLIAPLIATGNCVVAVPSWRYPLLATDFCQVLDTSGLPAGVVNVITGHPDELAIALAQHDNVASVWYVGSARTSALVERESAGNLKTTWVNHGKRRNWLDDHQAQGWEYLRRTVQIKNIWVPYGE